jgi:signal transduction histidine kinase
MKNDITNIKDRRIFEIEKDMLLEMNFNDLSRIEIITTTSSGSLKKRGESRLVYLPSKKFIGNDLFIMRGFDKGEKIRNILVMIQVTELVFKPRARLLSQLGDQLIRNESIALIELIKNCYDADAESAIISMSKVDNIEQGTIVIEDTGTGMDLNIIKNVWLEPGSDYKAKLIAEKRVTPKFKRLPIGEKGIGRFAVHKLGNYIELITRKSRNEEICVTIDWAEFEKFKYLKEAPIKIEERTPRVFTGNKTGTRLVISRLKKSWNKEMAREVFRAVNSIASPFDEKNPFKPKFEIDNEWLKGLLSWDDFKDYSLFTFDITMSNDLITAFKYSFTPWESLKLEKGRVVTKQHKFIRDLLKLKIDENNTPKSLNLKDARIGNIRFKGYIFVLERKILKLALSEPAQLSSYLKENGGVKVYRDGMRVYDYGEQGNDWLNLDYRRFNKPGVKISNNMIVAAVHLNRKTSGDLIEKTNREGFIENAAYRILKNAILYVLGLVEMLRKEDKDIIDALYEPTKTSEPVLKSINELRILVVEKVKDNGLKKEIIGYVDKIKDDYSFINEVLLKSASAGLSLGVVIHEVEKIILELEKVVQREKTTSKIFHLVKHLSDLIENYTLILRKASRKEEDLIEIIDQTLFNVEYRLQVHKIEVIKQYLQSKRGTQVTLARSLIIGTLMNIIDNSIYWLEREEKKNKKLFFDISLKDRGYVSLVIADNGPGFALPTEQITEPFVSAKVDGMGLGLHIAREIMLTHHGKISFPEWGEFFVPQEFKRGATVVLGFKE